MKTVEKKISWDEVVASIAADKKRIRAYLTNPSSTIANDIQFVPAYPVPDQPAQS